MDLKAEMKTLRFWASSTMKKGYFIVVYNGITKAPEVFQVDYNEI